VSDLKRNIEAANEQAMKIMLSGRPILVDVAPAIDVLPNMTANTILYSAPPIAWEKMCGPHRAGITGAALWEGLANSAAEADEKVRAGEITLAPCHHYASVGAGAGITSASTPMLVVENKTFGNRAFSCLSEGGGLRLIKWGCYDDDIAKHLTWQAQVLGPILGKAVRASGGIDIKSIIAKAVQMGDECHNRSIACTSLFFRDLIEHLAECDAPKNDVRDCIQFLVKADQFFLHGIMAAAKAILEPVKNIEHSTIVTAMARNGVEFGIQVSGLGDTWFTAPANHVKGLYFRSEWNEAAAAPDLGDSSITETIGLGGFIQAAAPSVQQYVKGSMEQAMSNTTDMLTICATTNPDVQIPAMDFAAAPVGIDIRKVVQTGNAPLIDTAITHKEGGLIGAGQVLAPMKCFSEALKAFSEKYSTVK
jgi:hypothetical protein